MPYFISLAALKIYGLNATLKEVFLYSVILLYLNSSLNPVIYRWKMRHIRHAVVNVLRSMFWHRNRVSHETIALAGHAFPEYIQCRRCCQAAYEYNEIKSDTSNSGSNRIWTVQCSTSGLIMLERGLLVSELSLMLVVT